VSKADAQVQEELLRLHAGEGRPVVQHWVAVE
jgi:hypothetical protein